MWNEEFESNLNSKFQFQIPHASFENSYRSGAPKSTIHFRMISALAAGSGDRNPYIGAPGFVI